MRPGVTTVSYFLMKIFSKPGNHGTAHSFCLPALRLLTEKEDLTVKEVRMQYRISKLLSHDAILDVLAEDEKSTCTTWRSSAGIRWSIFRRTRFYGAMIDSEYLEKGKKYMK